MTDNFDNEIVLPKMIKLLHNDNYRRIKWATNVRTHKDLVELIRRVIPDSGTELFYRDSDDDLIMFNTDEELHAMLDYFRDDLKTDTVKLETRVVECQQDTYKANPLHHSSSMNAEMVSKIVKVEVEKAMLGWEKAKLESELEKILPMNHWDSANCHPDLSIDDSLLVVERHKETTEEFAFVRAKMMMPHHLGIFYFEVKVTKMGTPPSWLSVGLAPQSLKLSKTEEKGIYSYDSDGVFWGHNVDGCVFYEDDKKMPYLEGQQSYGVGDVVGCGVNLATNQIIYTKNGRRLNTANLFVSDLDLYPCVGLSQIGGKVEANFGKREFAYKEIERGNGA